MITDKEMDQLEDGRNEPFVDESEGTSIGYSQRIYACPSIRYTWIDGLFVEVTKCRECPFYATECELGAECRYPCDPANNGKMFDWNVNGIRDDCPLRG